MTSDEELYKREEDRKWRESVETRLVSLTSAQKNTDDELDDHASRLERLDDLLEGKPEDKNDSGLKGDIQDLARGLKKLEVIMAPDSLQQGGVIKRLEKLEDLAGIRREARKERWKLAGIVFSVTVTAMAGIITALLAIDPIRDSLGRWFESHISVSKPKKPEPRKQRKPKRPLPPVIEEAPDGQAAGNQQ